jgi:hypothetical protein
MDWATFLEIMRWYGVIGVGVLLLGVIIAVIILILD